jgi:hypothetical protein
MAFSTSLPAGVDLAIGRQRHIQTQAVGDVQAEPGGGTGVLPGRQQGVARLVGVPRNGFETLPLNGLHASVVGNARGVLQHLVAQPHQKLDRVLLGRGQVDVWQFIGIGESERSFRRWTCDSWPPGRWERRPFFVICRGAHWRWADRRQKTIVCPTRLPDSHFDPAKPVSQVVRGVNRDGFALETGDELLDTVRQSQGSLGRIVRC